MVKTPWTDEQVKSLNEYQEAGYFHPFTCANGSHVLRATSDGWVCDECMRFGSSYHQDWCHEFMADGTWRKAKFPFGETHDRHPDDSEN